MESGEEWIVEQARQCIKSDPYASKAWLVTARTLYAKSFPVQYEAYTIEKNGRDVKEVAKLLEEMLLSFSHEPELWTEVTFLSEALQSENLDEKTTFQKAVFAALPASLQCQILLRIADSSSNVLTQSRLMLLVLSQYRDQVPDQGVKLVDSLLNTEKNSQMSTPLNCYRKYFVCNVLPTVLKTPSLSVPPKQLYRWLQKAMEFYVCYVTEKPESETLPPSAVSDLKSPGKLGFSGRGRVLIPGLSERDSAIDDPWQQLFTLISLTAAQLDWQLEDFFEKSSCGAQWQWVQTQWETTVEQSDPSAHVKLVFYCCVALFLHCLHKYSCHLDPQLAESSSGISHGPAVLVEALDTAEYPPAPEHKIKKLKGEPGTPKITCSKQIGCPQDVTEALSTAVKCWQLLHSNETLEKELTKLLQHWRSENWIWLRRFEIDVLMLQGSYKEATVKLQQHRDVSAANVTGIDLQLACCSYSLGHYAATCERLLAVVSGYSRGADHVTPENHAADHATQSGDYLMQTANQQAEAGRRLQLLVCSEAEVMPYCVQLLIKCFKEKAFKTSQPSDLLLGHMLVLMQYNWPKNETLFCDIINKIRRQESFAYSLFFNYVINIDILEEFAFLREEGKLTLDILPVSTKLLAQTRTVTRGVNKGVKEDFRAALERQVIRSEESIDAVLMQFFVEEVVALKQSLA